jgi:hypothetical protein
MQESYKRIENMQDLTTLWDYIWSPSDARFNSNFRQGYVYTTLLNRNHYKWKVSNVVCVLWVRGRMVFIGAQGWFTGRREYPGGQVDNHHVSHVAGRLGLPCNCHFPRRIFLLDDLEAFPWSLSGNRLKVGSVDQEVGSVDCDILTQGLIGLIE